MWYNRYIMRGYFEREISSVVAIAVILLVATAVVLVVLRQSYEILKDSVEVRKFYQEEVLKEL